MLKIAIAGVGAMGSLLAAYLAPQTNVLLFGHWPEQIAALNNADLSVQIPGKGVFRQQVHAANDPANLGKPDILLIVVKSTQTTTVSEELVPHLPKSTTIITLQNGLGNWEKLTAVFPHNPVTSGVTALGATMLSPGHIQQAGFGATHLTVSDNMHPTTAVILQQFAHILNNAGLETHLSQDVDGLVWGKLAINAAINPLTAILQKHNGYLLEDATMCALMWAAAEEAAHLAIFLGIELPYRDVQKQVTAVAHTTALNYSSMLQDIQRGVPTEIDSICGAVVRNGSRVNYPTPINAQLFEIVKNLECNKIDAQQAQSMLEHWLQSEAT